VREQQVNPMNSQFQKAPGRQKAGRAPSASDPPYTSGDQTGPSSASGPLDTSAPPSQSHTGASPAGSSNFDTTPGSGVETGSGSSGFQPPPKLKPTGSDALREQAEDAIVAATESVSQASDAVREASSQIGDVAKEAMRATVSAVSAQAAELTQNITHELSATAESQKERGADAMHRFAKAIRTAAQDLDNGSPEVARQIRAAAGSLDSLSDNLHAKSVGDLFKAAQDFARNQPAAFFAGAVIAGFAFSRFLKSSGQPASPSNGRDQSMGPPNSMPGTQRSVPGTQGVTPSAPSPAGF
jgi:hypothetical protein